MSPSPAPVMPIDVVSDVVCPWCFIGKRRLENALALRPNIPVEVHFRPYFLNPWVPREGMSREGYLTTKFGSPERYRAIGGRVSAAAAAEAFAELPESTKRRAAGSIELLALHIQTPGSVKPE